MVALEDDEAVCIPEKIRLSMLNLSMNPFDPAYHSWRIHSVCLRNIMSWSFVKKISVFFGKILTDIKTDERSRKIWV